MEKVIKLLWNGVVFNAMFRSFAYGHKMTCFDLFLGIVSHQIKSDVFSFFRTCKSLLFAFHLDMTRPRAHAEPLLFSSIVHLKRHTLRMGFL